MAMAALSAGRTSSTRARIETTRGEVHSFALKGSAVFATGYLVLTLPFLSLVVMCRHVSCRVVSCRHGACRVAWTAPKRR